jgi:TIR domain
MRDHLFISYAGEDWPFVEWLTLRLTAEGYRVWCDRIKLLGGESYPKDIDEAIKNRTFRLLAVLSRNSVRKPNPLKERTLALNLARERDENFLIPLNLDGLSPTDLGWMVSDLAFILFHLSWAEGLARLLKLLEESDAPRDFINGRSAAAAWFEAKDLVIPKEERLWANVAKIVELPTDIYRFEMEVSVSEEERLEILKLWPYSPEGEIFWSFVHPPADLIERYRLKERGKITDWKSARSTDISVRQVAVRVFNQSLRSLCLARGLKVTPDGGLCYFPDALLPGNRLTFRSYDSQRTWVRTVGVRNFRTLTGNETCRYHLAPYLRLRLDHELGNLLQIRVRLFLTTLEGRPLEEEPALRRRKRICRSWWNYEWLSRTVAILQFLAGESLSIQVGTSESQRMIISKRPLAVGIGYSLNEALLEPSKPEAEESEEAVMELNEEEKPGQGGGENGQ